MSNDNIMNELVRLKTEAMGVVRVENAYNVLVQYKGMSLINIQKNIIRQIQSREVSDEIKYFLVWALTNINAGLSEQDYDSSVDGMKNIVDNQKSKIESSLMALFNQNPVAKTSETPLFNQLVAGEESLKQMYEELTGEEFPGLGGR